MAVKDLLIKEKVEYSGLFNFSGLYKFMHGWLTNEQGYGVVEDKYNEKVTGPAKDIGIEWTASKGMGDYFKVELKIDIRANGLTDVEVEIDGVKKKMQKGNVSIDMKGALIKDPGSKWESKPLDKFLRGWYDKFIIPQQTDGMEGKARGDVKGLKEEVKSFLELSAKR
jgi:hypothetical protein